MENTLNRLSEFKMGASRISFRKIFGEKDGDALWIDYMKQHNYNPFSLYENISLSDKRTLIKHLEK